MNVQGFMYSYSNGHQKSNQEIRKLVCRECKLREEINGEVKVRCLSKVTVRCVNGNWIAEKFSPHSIL